MLTRLRRVLSDKVSVEAMIEVVMWLAIPFILIGIAWSFVHADDVQQIEIQLQTRLPAGSDLVAFGISTALWPVLLVAPDDCDKTQTVSPSSARLWLHGPSHAPRAS